MSGRESTKTVEWWCADSRNGQMVQWASEETARDHVFESGHCALVKRTVTVVDLVVQKARVSS